MTRILARLTTEENDNNARERAVSNQERIEKKSLRQKFLNLAIARKTGLIPWFTLIALSLIVGSGGIILRNSLKSQLLQQAQSQLAVADLAYNISFDGMGFGFRGQSDNEAIVTAAVANTVTEDLRQQIREILRNEIKARDIEYATLVGKDKRIIASANADRTGEVFDPQGLVSQVLRNPQQIRTSELVAREELAVEKPTILSELKGEYALVRYILTPVFDDNNQVSGVLVSGDIVDGKLAIVERAVAALTSTFNYSAIYLRQPTAEFALATSILETSDNSRHFVPLADREILRLAVANQGATVTQFAKIDDKTYAIAARAISDREGKPVGIILFGNFADSTIFWRSMSVQLVLGVLIIAVIYLLAKVLASAIADPIQNLQQVTQEFATGNTEVRASVNATDEIGLLASTFNVMADVIEANERRLREEARRSVVRQEIASEIARTTEVSELLQVVVAKSQSLIEADRVAYYRFHPDWQGEIVAEAVREGLPKALDSTIYDCYLTVENVELYLQGRVETISDIYKSELDEQQMQLLASQRVRASAIAPVVVGERLLGLLIAHQHDSSREWQESDLDSLSQIASQLGNALTKIELLENQKQAEIREREAKERLQRRALELLMEVDPVSQGDLSIRVEVGDDEIGTIADSYNATIENLRQLAIGVQSAAGLVLTTTSDKNISLQELSTNALEQTQEITAALQRVRDIIDSIKTVAENAAAAKLAVSQAADTVKAGDKAMNLTVAGFDDIRATVAATAKKVKRLGESSQKISKVVNVINSFADRTNLLALNASIEAAHAGDEGRGFAIVAEEVRSLARQSAEATAEIAALIEEIQAETNEVVAAMESGTEQVVVGTKLVADTRLSLNQIAEVSGTIYGLVNAIAKVTVKQTQDSEVVSQAMAQVAAISDKTAAEATEASASFQELLEVARRLQESVAKFKV